MKWSLSEINIPEKIQKGIGIKKRSLQWVFSPQPYVFHSSSGVTDTGIRQAEFKSTFCLSLTHGQVTELLTLPRSLPAEWKIPNFVEWL